MDDCTHASVSGLHQDHSMRTVRACRVGCGLAQLIVGLQSNCGAVNCACSLLLVEGFLYDAAMSGHSL